MLLAAILSCLPSASSPQVHLGVLVGIQGSTLVGDDAVRRLGERYPREVGKPGTLSTGEIGMALDFEGANASVRTGALYSAKGWTRREGEVTWEQHLNYFVVPLELHLIAFKPSEAIRPYLSAGAYWAARVNAEIRSDDYPELNERNTKEWKPSTVGVSVGAGAQGKVQGYRIGGQLRIHRDLTVNFRDSRDTYNQTIGLDLFAGI